MCVSLFLKHLTDNLALLNRSYDFPSNVENVPFQSNHSGMPKYYHHTTGSLGGPWTEHAHPWRKSIPDLDFDFIESEAFYQDLTGMGLSSFSTNRDRSSPGAVKGEAIQLTSIPSKRIAPHQSINNPTSSRDLKFLGGFEDAHKSGKPIAIIASPECLFDPIQLPSEYAYSFLGLFFLVDIHVSSLSMQLSQLKTDVEFSGKLERRGLSFRCYPIRP